MQVVVAFDPGGTTGMCVARKPDKKDWTFEHYELSIKPHHELLWRTLNYLNAIPSRGDELTVVYELFDHRSNDAAELISCEYIGIILLWCSLRGVRVVGQIPSEAMNFWTDNKLKQLELFYVTPQGHANDATRHALRFITKWDKTFIFQLKGFASA
jgi:hypothetical protein